MKFYSILIVCSAFLNLIHVVKGEENCSIIDSDFGSAGNLLIEVKSGKQIFDIFFRLKN